jgi:elongator complex protein 1
MAHPESAPHLVEDAVKYIIFLVDANTLFDLALGMYDFSLVLMIAQHAQKVIQSCLITNRYG